MGVEDDRSNPYRVLRVWVRTSAEKTQMTRLSFYLSFMGLATAVAPLAGRADVVVATTPPLFTGVAGLAIARMNRAPFVLDVRDLWPAAATSLLQISPGWETRAAEQLERRLYSSAAAVTAVTRPFCRHVDALRGRGPRAVLIPNGTIPQFFVDRDGEDGRLGVPPDRFLLTFAGILGIAQALPSALEAAAQLEDVADLLLVGDGPMKPIVSEQARTQGLGNVRFHPQIPLEQIPPVLAASDALLVPLSAHPTFEQFVPSKMIDYMAVGRPVVLSAAGEAARILERSGGGIAVAPESPDDLARAVRWLAEHSREAAEMGRRGRAFAATRLRSTQAERLEQVSSPPPASAPRAAKLDSAWTTPTTTRRCCWTSWEGASSRTIHSSSWTWAAAWGSTPPGASSGPTYTRTRSTRRSRRSSASPARRRIRTSATTRRSSGFRTSSRRRATIRISTR